MRSVDSCKKEIYWKAVFFHLSLSYGAAGNWGSVQYCNNTPHNSDRNYGNDKLGGKKNRSESKTYAE